jgi:hypothetical protein
LDILGLYNFKKSKYKLYFHYNHLKTLSTRRSLMIAFTKGYTAPSLAAGIASLLLGMVPSEKEALKSRIING